MLFKDLLLNNQNNLSIYGNNDLENSHNYFS